MAWSVLAVGVYLVAFHSLANLRLDHPLLRGVVARFWQQPNLFVCAWAGLGLAALAPVVGRLLAPIVIVLVGCQVGLNWTASDQHANWTIRDYGASSGNTHQSRLLPEPLAYL